MLITDTLSVAFSYVIRYAVIYFVLFSYQHLVVLIPVEINRIKGVIEIDQWWSLGFFLIFWPALRLWPE